MKVKFKPSVNSKAQTRISFSKPTQLVGSFLISPIENIKILMKSAHADYHCCHHDYNVYHDDNNYDVNHYDYYHDHYVNYYDHNNDYNCDHHCW